MASLGLEPGPGPLRSRLGQRLLALFLACVLLPILLLGILAYRQVTRNLRVEAERQLYQQTKLIALGLRERLALLESGFELLIERIGGLEPSVERWSPALEGVLGRQLEGLVWQDGDGSLTALFGSPQTVPEIAGEAAEHLAAGGLLVVTADAEREPLARILVARAARAADGRAGVLWGEVDPRYLWALGPDRALPPQSELAVLDASGFLIRTPAVPEALAAGLRSSSERGDGVALEWLAGDQAMIASHRAVPLETRYGAGTWIVSVSQRLDQALGPLQRFRRDFPRIVLILALVAVLVSLSQIRRSLGPLDALRAATQRIAERDFSQPVALASGDEFEQLGDAFNRMAAEIERRLAVAETQAAVDRSALTAARAEDAVETLLDRIGAIVPSDEAQVTLETARGESRNYRRHAPRSEATGRTHALEVPVRIGDRSLGRLTLERRDPAAFEPAERALVDELASHLALVLNHLELGAVVDRERERLRALVEHLPHGVLVLDGAHRLLLANRLGREYLPELSEAGIGDSLSALGGRPLGAWHDDDAGSWQELELAGPPPRIFVVAVVALSQSPEAPESEAGSIVMLRDVTVERAGAERMQRQERLVTVGRMAAGIAHDLNNVLQAILMGANLLAARSEDREAELILSQSRRASGMIRQILDFTRESTSRPERVDLVVLVRDSVQLIEMTFGPGIDLRLELPATPLWTWVDPGQIQQMVHNLVVNARDAMTAGGGLLTVRLRSLEGEDAAPKAVDGVRAWCQLAVSDTGEGIPAAVQPHIFDPFFTTKRLGVGTGLGLAQVLGIVDRHFGTIEFTTGSEGTTFTVLLPRHEGAAGAVARPALELGSASARATSGAVLVVDDDEVVLQSVEYGLREIGFEVLAARDGDEAWARWQRDAERIDLVLADVRMPGLSGVDLLYRIRDRDPDLPVILMSGYAGAKVDHEVLRVIHGWLEKPFTIEDLARVTREAIAGS